MRESEYQAELIKRLEERFPGCVILKNDSAYQQGILDLTLLYGESWACLEVKRHKDAVLQPNQEFFVRKLSDMSYAAIIYPENEEEVLVALEQAFASRRGARVPQS
jgi:hypothetical protein